MSYSLADANGLVSYIQDFTGSSNATEIQECIFLTEMMLRNIEIPALRTDPYSSQYIGVADSLGRIPIPADMNRPILFFKQGGVSADSSLGPWIVYDRIGDRDMITESLIENLYLKPLNIPSVYRGKFSEVGAYYQFLPALGEGDQVNLYYYQIWPFLFSPISGGGTVLTNAVFQTWPEGYIYGTLHNYYLKRKMPEDAAVWKAKFDDAWHTVEDQVSKAKWSGGNTRLTSVFQPRKDRRFSSQ